MARQGVPKDEMYESLLEWFEYGAYSELKTLHEEYAFDPSCQGTVPVALACVMQADDFEQVMRNGLYVGGDTDTLLSIAGAIAEPLYGVPEGMRAQAEKIMEGRSPALLGMLKEFERKYGAGRSVAKRSRIGGLFTKILGSAPR
jgi:ADP-ribosylglycohydrolase